jgi:hypothetical protein
MAAQSPTGERRERVDLCRMELDIHRIRKDQ